MPHEERPKSGESLEEIVEPTGLLVRTSPQGSGDRLPDWAPWAALASLLGVGLLGGLGLLPTGLLDRDSRRPASTFSRTASGLVPTRTALAATALPIPSASAAPAPHEYITASHVVVSYAGTLFAKRYHVTRTKDEAKRLAEEILSRARKGEDFAKLVAQHSDDLPTKAQNGHVGRFTKRDALPAFADVVFALKPGELGIAETGFGYHVILRTE